MLEKLKPYLTRQNVRTALLVLGVAIVSVLSYEAVDPEVELAVRTTPTATVTATKASRATPTLTSTALPPTATPVPGTPTVQPPVTPTLASPCLDNVWHEPLDYPGCHHHHGVNPADYEEVFALDGFSLTAFFDEHGWILQPASVTLNENPDGRVYFYVQAEDGCEKDFEGIATPMPDAYDCVTDVIYGPHVMAHLSHLLGNGISTHSEVYIAKICKVNPSGELTNDCYIAAGAVQINYGPTHADYKDDICYMANAPAGYPLSQINQPPYNTILPADKYDPARSPFIQSYWVNSNPNPVVAQFYPPGTNSIMNSAWLELDVWAPLPKELVCGKNLSVEETKAILNAVPPVLTDAHRIFKINDFTILAPQFQTPFEGFVNAAGQVVDSALCGQEGQICWPVVYTGEVTKPATLHRGAEPGTCEGAENPCIIFDFPVEIVYPLHDH